MGKTGRATLITLQAVWFLFLIPSLLFPLFFTVSFIVLLVLTTLFYIKNIRVNLYFMLVVLAAACIATGGDFLYVIFTVLMFAGLLGLLWGLKWRSYLAGSGITALIMIVFVIIPFVVYCPVLNKTPENFIAEYACESAAGEKIVFSSDSQFGVLSASLYYNYNGENFTPLKQGDDGYDEDRIRIFERLIWEGMDNLYSIFTTIGAVVGISSFLLIYLINKKTPALTLKSFNEFKINTEPADFKNMRLNRKYFIYIFLPVLLFWLLSLINAFALLNPVALALYRACAVVPCAASALAFVYHTISRIKLKGFKLYLFAIWWVLLAFVVLFPFAAFIVSFIGIFDSLFPLRRGFDIIFRTNSDSDKGENEDEDSDE